MSDTTGIIQANYAVTGMTCGHCVSSVTEELNGIPGVQSVEVALDPQGVSTVTVASAHPIEASAIDAAVTEAGYTLVSSAR
jgi:copper chaperone CopZ